MKLDITSIIKNNGGTISIQLEEALEDLKTSLGTVSFTSPVSFTGSITNNNGMLKLTGRAKLVYSTVCDRCAGRIEREHIVDIDEEIIEKEETDLDLEDDRFTYSGNSLDLDKVLADCVLTSIPMTQVCSEDCQGLCPLCGAEISEKGCNCENHDSIDSRLEGLKGFFD
ncbi:MAG TPA: DUF177 domain-containing protein [Clostridiaceae bacterium]|nr:DUF177 domain-containing protein [Clostridiaceae bacterium]